MYTLEEGKTYTIVATVTNTSRRADTGAPVATKLGVAIRAWVGDTVIIDWPVYYTQFGAVPSDWISSVQPLSYSITIPAGTAGKSGKVRVRVTSPTGAELAAAEADITISPIQAVAGITGIDFGPLPKVQGESFPITIHIESNFTGTAWVVLAYGQGQPAPGATFRAVTEGAVYKGWFPEPFKPPPNYLPAVFSVDLVAGQDNVVTQQAKLARDFPLGDYIPYAAVMPPASDWNNWPLPYGWATGTPFNVAEEPPQVTVAALIGQNVTPVGAPFSGGVYGGGVYGLAGEAYNHFSPFAVNPGYCSSFPDSCLLLPYMQFWQPGAVTNMQIGGSSQQRWGNLGAGVYIISDPPLTPNGIPAKYYQVSLQGRLIFPDGTFLEKAMSLSVPRTSTHEYYYLSFGKEEYGWLMDTLPPGQYTYRLRVTVEGLDWGEQVVSFTVN